MRQSTGPDSTEQLDSPYPRRRRLGANRFRRLSCLPKWRDLSMLRDLIRSLPVHSASGLPVYVAASRTAPFRLRLVPLGMTSASGIEIFAVVLALRRELDLLITGFRILEDFAFVIPNHDFLVVVIKNVTGIDRHLAAAAGRVDHELRHSVTAGMAAQAFDDFDTLRDRRTQMRRAVNQVALINVVWTHATHEEFVHKRLHSFQIVVHPGEQNALVSERDTRVGETLQRLLHLNRQLARMIHMHTHPKRMIFRQYRAQLRCDALRQANRNARANAEKLNVRNRPQS